MSEPKPEYNAKLKKAPAKPVYRAELKLTLPADPPWRDTARSFPKLLIDAAEPDQLWQSVMRAVLVRLGFTQANLLVGVLLNLINSFPDEIRESITFGIIQGMGLVLAKEEGADQIVAKFEEVWAPLNTIHLEQREAASTPGDAEVRPSGLVVPTSGIAVPKKVRK